jgi:hypothetical protein
MRYKAKLKNEVLSLFDLTLYLLVCSPDIKSLLYLKRKKTRCSPIKHPKLQYLQFS